eukprot:TRINITY_DN8000_c0_g1_i1.p1 TRINITY_DN8000_c0_g1~~TRINITY_DN8000_c0_g1_i1.p1  ORF type:complete len:1691 (-),score=398.94 TRINITY_DN8000_c0_g1_i1:202-5274(-)
MSSVVVKQKVGNVSVRRKVREGKHDLYDFSKLQSIIKFSVLDGKLKHKGVDISDLFPMKITENSIWVTWNILVSLVFRFGVGERAESLRKQLCEEPEVPKHDKKVTGSHNMNRYDKLDIKKLQKSKSSTELTTPRSPPTNDSTTNTDNQNSTTTTSTTNNSKYSTSPSNINVTVKSSTSTKEKKPNDIPTRVGEENTKKRSTSDNQSTKASKMVKSYSAVKVASSVKSLSFNDSKSNTNSNPNPATKDAVGTKSYTEANLFKNYKPETKTNVNKSKDKEPKRTVSIARINYNSINEGNKSSSPVNGSNTKNTTLQPSPSQQQFYRPPKQVFVEPHIAKRYQRLSVVTTKYELSLKQEIKIEKLKVKNSIQQQENTQKIQQITARDQKMQNIFSKIDTRNIGGITAHQLNTAISKWGIHLTEANAQTLIYCFGSNYQSNASMVPSSSSTSLAVTPSSSPTNTTITTNTTTTTTPSSSPTSTIMTTSNSSMNTTQQPNNNFSSTSVSHTLNFSQFKEFLSFYTMSRQCFDKALLDQKKELLSYANNMNNGEGMENSATHLNRARLLDVLSNPEFKFNDFILSKLPVLFQNLHPTTTTKKSNEVPSAATVQRKLNRRSITNSQIISSKQHGSNELLSFSDFFTLLLNLMILNKVFSGNDSFKQPFFGPPQFHTLLRLFGIFLSVYELQIFMEKLDRTKLWFIKFDDLVNLIAKLREKKDEIQSEAIAKRHNDRNILKTPGKGESRLVNRIKFIKSKCIFSSTISFEERRQRLLAATFFSKAKDPVLNTAFQLYESKLQQLLATNTLFNDTEFPPLPADFPSQLKFLHPSYTPKDGEKSTIQWLRPADIIKMKKQSSQQDESTTNDKPPPPTLFDDTIDDGDIIGGTHSIRAIISSIVKPQANSSSPLLSNRMMNEDIDIINNFLNDDDGPNWLLCSFAVLASNGYDMLKDLFLAANFEVGIYLCKIFVNGDWRYVIIDDLLPCDSNYNLAFGMCRNENEFWVPLLQKAYAKVFGGYHTLSYGSIANALVDLTGEMSESVYITNSSDSTVASDRLWNNLRNYAKSSLLLSAISQSLDEVDSSDRSSSSSSISIDHHPLGIHLNKTYTILELEEIEGNRLIRLRNSWGDPDWVGRWSNASEEWNPSLTESLNMEWFDGVFFMAFEEFVQIFTKIFVMRHSSMDHEFGIRWKKYEFIEESWSSKTAGGCLNEPTWHKNPQYLVKFVSTDDTPTSLNDSSSNNSQSIRKKSQSVKDLKSKVLNSSSSSSKNTPTSFNIYVCIRQIDRRLPNSSTKELHGSTALTTLATATSPSLAYPAIGFAVLKRKNKSHQNSIDDKNKLLAIDLDSGANNQLHMKTTFDNVREVCHSFVAKPNTDYVVIPSTYYSGIDGKFSISFLSSKKLTIEKLEDPQPLCTVAGHWDISLTSSTSGGSTDHSTWWKNPQYHLQIKTTGKYDFILEQELQNDAKEYSYIGFHVWKTELYKGVITRKYDNTDVVYDAEYNNSNVVKTSVKLTEGHYVVMCSTYNSGELGRYSMKIYGNDVPVDSKSCSLTLIPTDKYRCEVKGEWKTANSAGGCSNNPTWLDNPKYNLVIPSESKNNNEVILSIMLEQPVNLNMINSKSIPHIGFYLFSENKNHPQNIIQESEFSNSMTVSKTVSLAPGDKYVIMPSTYVAQQEQTFTLNVFCNSVKCALSTIK